MRRNEINHLLTKTCILLRECPFCAALLAKDGDLVRVALPQLRCMGPLHESVHVASLWSVTRVSSPRKEWENILTTRDHLHRSSARVSVLAPPPEQHVLHQRY